MRIREALILSLALLLSAGCGNGGGGGDTDAGTDAGSDAGTDGGTDGGTGEYSCTRDPALLAEAIRCNRDDQCPCGAHCRLGQCDYECMEDADCDGDGWCDLFGYCRAADGSRLSGVVLAPRYVGLAVRSRRWSGSGRSRTSVSSSEAVTSRRPLTS